MFNLIQCTTSSPNAGSVPQLLIGNDDSVDPTDLLAPSHVAVSKLHCLPKNRMSPKSICPLSAGYLRSVSTPLESRLTQILISSFTLFLNHFSLRKIEGL